jgi:hypothetical protein
MKNRAGLAGGTTYSAGQTQKVGTELPNEELRLCSSPATVRVMRWGGGGAELACRASHKWEKRDVHTEFYCLSLHHSAVFHFAVLPTLSHFTPGYVVDVLPCILFGGK